MTSRTSAAVAWVLAGAAFAVAAAPAAKGAGASAPAASARTGASAARASSAPAAAASAPTAFAGTLVTGTTYVADMAFDGQALHVWRPIKEVTVAKDIAWTIQWTNLDQFPALKTPATQARPQRFRFRVAKTDMLSGSPKLPWMVTYQCEILAFEPVPPVAPPAAPPSSRKR